MSKKKSDWLPAGQKPCLDCKGTGDTGGRTSKGETIACPTCRGSGY